MLPALTLGVRLSTSGGWRRPAFMTVVSAVGAYLLVAAWELPGAVLAPVQVDGQERTVTVATLLAVIAVPVALLLLAVNRLSAQLRDQRLARLRLLGLPAWQVRLVAAGENGVFASVGALLGVMAFALTAPSTGRALMDGGVPLVSTFPASLLDLLRVVLAVTLLAAVVAMAPHRTIAGNGLSDRMDGKARAPSSWRLLPLLVGLLLTGSVITRALWPDVGQPPSMLAAFITGTVLTAVGVVIALAPLMNGLASLLSRGLMPVPVMLAVRRQKSEPTSIVRLLVGLVLAVFLTAFAMGPIAAFEATPQFAAATQIASDGPRGTTIGSDTPINASKISELQQTPGVIATWGLVNDDVSCEGHEGWSCQQPIVATCASVTAILGPGTCSEHHATFVRLDDRAPKPSVLTTNSTGPTIKTPVVDIRSHPNDGLAWQLGGSQVVVLTPAMAHRLGLTSDLAIQVWTSADDRADAAVATWATTMGSQQNISDSWRSTLAELNRYRLLVQSVGAVVIGLGLLIVLIATMDRANERRKAVAALAVIGTPRRTLVIAQLVQAVLGIIPATVLALGCGVACALAYLNFASTDSPHLPWNSWTTVTLVAIAGALVVAAATTAGVGGRTTPETLRRE